MAALQKIRSYGVLLVLVIGLGLFAFIAEDFFRAVQTLFGVSNQQVGQVYGKKLSIQDYNEMVSEAEEMYKLQMQTNSLTDAQRNQLRDQVWQQYVQYQLIAHEADELGLQVTDAEVQNALSAGTSQTLVQFAQTTARAGIPYFVSPQGNFSVTGLQNFFKQLEEAKSKGIAGEQLEAFENIKRLWNYTETQLRRELLMTKYQGLLFQSYVSNPQTAKQLFNDYNETAQALVATIPNTSITGKDAEVSDADLKETYNQYKELFYNEQETRDLKVIDVNVTASQKDREELDAKMADYYQQIVAGEDLAGIINASNSLAHYSDICLRKTAFPRDIQNELDSISVGGVKAPYYNAQDNTLNIVKLVAKQELPDSVLFRAIGVQGKDDADVASRADSIMNALKAGADFKGIAKNYAQPGDSTWMTSAMYEETELDAEGVKYITAINTTGVGAFANVEVGGGRLILQVLDRKSNVTKYNAAVVKVPVDFSKATYDEASNKLNVFLAKNKTLADIEKNAAKEGYILHDMKDFTADAGFIAGIADTKDAVKWIFDEAKKGDISKVYEAGEAKEHLLLVAVADIHKKGYRNWDDAAIKEYLTSLATAAKKSQLALKKFDGVKTIAEAQQKGAVVDTISNISFMANSFIPAVSAPEPIIGAVVAKTEASKVAAPVAGGNGAFLVQVLSKTAGEQKFDAKLAEQTETQMNQQMLSQGIIRTLLRRAKITDNRYKF